MNYNIKWGWGGSSSLQSVLQYYRFGRNMEGLKSFSVLHIYTYMFLCGAKSTYCVTGVIFPIYYNITRGGGFPIYYNIT